MEWKHFILLLTGMEIPCKNEGEIVKPKIAKGNPCVTCVCKVVLNLQVVELQTVPSPWGFWWT